MFQQKKVYCLDCKRRVKPLGATAMFTEPKEDEPVEYENGYRCKKCAKNV